MATESKGKAKKAAKRTKASTTAKAAKSNGRPAPAQASPIERARRGAETVVDIPVGAVLEVTDRVSDLVEPFTARTSASRQLRSYRTSLRRNVKRTERRGATARRTATTEARKTRSKVEREARRRRQTVETTLKRNRSEVEQRVRKAIDEQASRAQELVEQLPSLR